MRPTLRAALALALPLALAGRSAADGPRFPILTDAEAWAAMPRAEAGGGGPLPTWARTTARPLPRTTAAMLDLDRLHRTKSPLGPSLRGKMRWVAADANRCEYARATAEADLRRAGVGDAEIAALKGGYERWPVTERPALQFAREMTLDAGKVTDPEVAEVRQLYGDSKLVAMVLLLAAANFQDRLLLSLGVPLEEGGPMPPLEVRWDKDAIPPVPGRLPPVELAGPPVPSRVDDPLWAATPFEALKRNMEAQKANEGRVRVPTFEEMLKGLPADYPPPRSPTRIKWSLVCMGYQPELAIAWSACTGRFGQEAKQDRVFEESLFWVVTRTISCFY